MRPGVAVRQRNELEALADVVAYRLPKTPEEGVLAYIDERKSRIRSRLAGVSPLELPKIREHLTVLDWIAELMGKDMTAPAGEFRLPAVDRGRRIGAAEQRKREAEHRAHLYRLITPSGWRNTLRKTLADTLQRTEETILAGTEPGEDGEQKALTPEQVERRQMLHGELTSVLIWLDRVERNGWMAERWLSGARLPQGVHAA